MRGVNSRYQVRSLVQKNGVTISFVEHFARSEQFDQIFRNGMALVEATAVYLDGPGRREAKALSPAVAMTYAAESMRLTTRLLELASWLLVRRSIKTGEITADEARVKRRRIKLASVGRPAHVKSYQDLPPRLRELIEQSFALNDRIVQIDRGLEWQPEADSGSENPVIRQIADIEAAFGDISHPRH
jgi:regulator of CtrA degradation